MTEETIKALAADEHRKNLKILEKHLGPDYFNIGYLHNKISDAMSEAALSPTERVECYLPVYLPELPKEEGDYTCMFQADESEFSATLLFRDGQFFGYETEGIEYDEPEPMDKIIYWLKKTVLTVVRENDLVASDNNSEGASVASHSSTAPTRMGIGKLRFLINQFDKEEISMSKFLEEINNHFLKPQI